MFYFLRIIVFPKKSSYCKDHAIQGFVNQGPTVFQPSVLAFLNRHIYLEVNPLQGETEKHSDHGRNEQIFKEYKISLASPL